MNKLALRIYLWLWVVVGFLMSFQAYIMARQFFLLPLIVLLPVAFYYYGRHWFHAYEKRKTWSVIVNYIWIVLHFLPLLLQIITVIRPTWDHLITASFGVFLYLVTRPHKSNKPVLHRPKRKRTKK